MKTQKKQIKENCIKKNIKQMTMISKI